MASRMLLVAAMTCSTGDFRETVVSTPPVGWPGPEGRGNGEGKRSEERDGRKEGGRREERGGEEGTKEKEEREVGVEK